MKYKIPAYIWHREDELDHPLFVFGYYLRDDHKHSDILIKHRGFIVIVWSGSDSMDLNKKKIAVEYFKANKDRIKHIAWSHWIVSDLEAVGLDVVKRPVFPTTFEWLRFEPKSENKIYHYHPRDRNRYPVYGTDIVNNIEKRNLSGQFVKTCWGHVKPKSLELYNLYKKCSFGVRLTQHDNMALSCVEMGLMGRKSIFNGNIPCAIPWGREGVKEQIIQMWNINPMPNKHLADEMREFVYDDEKWLNTNYYE